MSGRKQRREYEIWLKKNEPAKYAEYKAEAKSRGQKVHQAHVENLRAKQDAFYEQKQKDIIASMRTAGRTDAEIDEYVAKWIEGIKAI